MIPDALLKGERPDGEFKDLRSGIVSQFKRPRGFFGSIAGWVMANRSSNIDRNYWTVEQLSLQTDMDVLEIGCGPGIGLKAALEAAVDTRVTGLDHSALMIAKAARRHAAAIKSDRLELIEGELKDLDPVRRFDAVFSCNVMQFVEDRDAVLELMLKHLKPGGGFATTFQPRGKCATAAEGRAWISQFAEDLYRLGYRDVDVREMQFGTLPAFCALGAAPGDPG